MAKRALLALEDGSLFWGTAIGAEGQTVGEVVFNTSMSGYQEILTDPSYCRQIITFTYPHIGNVGINEGDYESGNVAASGLIVRDVPRLSSNYRQQQNLSEFLIAKNIVGIADIDTRQLTRLLRSTGALKGCIVVSDNIDETAAVQSAKQFSGIKGLDLAQEVTTQEPYVYTTKAADTLGLTEEVDVHKLPYHVVAYDFGIKRNILQLLVARGCRVTVVPAKTPVDEVLAMSPDGVFLSNGPGDPEPCDYAVSAIKKLLTTEIPLFGICLGCQLLALASGAKTEKMKFGHHGANHPVRDKNCGEVFITSQNHGFCVSEQGLPKSLTITHRSLFDQSIQGIQHTTSAAFGFQGHPEASPGPHDITGLFDQYIKLIDEYKSADNLIHQVS